MIRFGRMAPARARIAVPTFVLLALALHPAGARAADCTTTVSSTSAAASAVSSAAAGATICLTDGSYGRLTLNASKSAPGVTVRAANPGQATIAGATLDGAYLTVAQFRMTGTADVRPGSTGMTLDHNFFDLNAYSGYGVMACASTTTTCNDVSIVGNRFVGRAEEDAIRANRYHDGPDADSYGLLVDGNEFTGNQETGEHNDVFQSVWVGDHLVFRRNYIHDFGGQGFFVKDQATAIDGLVVEDNLIVRQNLPCNPTSLCPTWQLSPFQVFGPLKNVSIRHNTVWPGSGGGTQWLRGSGWNGPTGFADNAMHNLNSDATLTTGYTASNNTRCGGNGFPSTGTTTDCAPAFIDAANGDYRQANGRGVTWRLADRQFGPGGESSPPPADTVAPRTTITSAPPTISLQTSGSVSFAVDDADATTQCRVDGGAWAACTSPYRVAGLSLGWHTVDVRSTDAAGNVESPSASVSWTVLALPVGGADDPPQDTDEEPEPPADAPPTVELTAPTADGVAGRDLRMAASVGDDRGVHHVEFWLDRTRVARDTRAPYTARVDGAKLRAGAHTVTVRAFDAAGQAASDAVTVRVARTARAAKASGPRATQLASVAPAEGATRLAGSGPRRVAVRVSLTPCGSAKGTIVDRVRLRAGDDGRLEAVRPRAGLCVLQVESG
jgi:hypothetical protein